MRHSFIAFFVIILLASPIICSACEFVSISSAGSAISAAVQNLIEVQSSFGGLYYGYGGSNTYVPPDNQVAAGPNHLIQMVNVMAGIYAKDGSLLQAIDLNSFFDAGNDNLSDPRVFYDSTSGRWFASGLDLDTFDVRIAVSSSSDPLGNWYVYTLSPSAAGYFPDQPILGVTLDKVVVSVNTFDSGGGFVGAEFWVMSKSAMMSGTNSYVHFGPYVDYLSIYPTTNLVSTQNQYMVSVEPDISGSFVLFSVIGTPPGSVTVVNTTISIKNFVPPVNGIQPNTRRTIDTSDGRVLSAIWTQSGLWFAFADSTTPAGDTQLRSSFRLVQVDTSTNTVLQDFDVNEAGYSYFYPALAVDGNENLIVLFGYSSPNDYPGLMVTAQAPTDATGTYETPLTLIQGIGPETSGRYGDYFDAAVDPSNPLVVWVTGQYGTNVGWHTRIASIKISTTTTPTTSTTTTGTTTPTTSTTTTGTTTPTTSTTTTGTTTPTTSTTTTGTTSAAQAGIPTEYIYGIVAVVAIAAIAIAGYLYMKRGSKKPKEEASPLECIKPADIIQCEILY